MSLLSTIYTNVTFLEVCTALVVIGVAERALLRYAPDRWLKAAGLSA